MIGSLGEQYTAKLRRAFAGRVPGGADLVCYWFDRAWEALASRPARRAGFVTTQSIRKGSNRQILDVIVQKGSIIEAWSDEPWVLDGADVRVSLVCFDTLPPQLARLDGRSVSRIHADLTAEGADMTTAKPLAENMGVASVGTQKNGQFDIDGTRARAWLQLPSNPNGKPNSDVVRPWCNGQHITGRPTDTWVVDFGTEMSEAEAAYYSTPFAYVAEHVRPFRLTLRREAYRRYWWRHAETRPAMRKSLAGLSRYIVTTRVAKHRVFVWMDAAVLPDTRVCVFAREDDTTLGILQSRFHQVWSLALASRHGVGNDPTYNIATCFAAFPFPTGLTPNCPAAIYADDPRAQAITQVAQALVATRDRWLNPAELVDHVPEVVAGFPDRIVPKNPAAAATLRTRTLTALYNQRGKPEGAWLDALHAALDAAVASAYGWPADLPDNEVLSRLLALNHAPTAVER